MEYKDVSIISIEERKRLERIEQSYKECKMILDNCAINYYRTLDSTNNEDYAKQSVLTDELLKFLLN